VTQGPGIPAISVASVLFYSLSSPCNKIETYSANKRSTMNVYELQPVFKITIPPNDMDLIEERLCLLKKLLVYLETPTCRKFMDEAERREKIKSATEHFRRLLQYKAYGYFK
jgi:hypothetical protein